MDYKVLYRKYRPDDFSNIIGQNYMINVLKNAIKKEHISHAYIFSGPRGTGKTSTAKVFAKAINCLNPTENGPCNKCDSCLHFKENADIIEIDAASNNGVDEIREIINNIKLAPAYSKYKVYIIDEVHMLSTSAFNALLLTLEEPPKHVVFILATTNIEAVPITILSRCQRFDFHKISTEEIITRLKYVVEQENITIDDNALEEIAYISDGGMRDALSILDQLSSTNSNITLEEVNSHFGSISKKQIDDMFKCIIENNVSRFVEIIDKLKGISVDYKLLIKKLLDRIEEEAIRIKKDFNYTSIDYNDLCQMAYDLADISNYVNINIDPYLLIEITLLKYTKNSMSKDKQDENKENPLPKAEIVQKTEKIISQEIISHPDLEEKQISHICEEVIEIRINNCFVNAKKNYLQKVKSNWSPFVSTLDDKSLLNLLTDSTIVASSDKVAIITSSNTSSVDLINNSLDEIAANYKKAFNEEYKFITITEERWQNEKNTYILNLKNNKPYKYIEEKTEEKHLSTDDSNNSSDSDTSNIESVALNIFDKDKIKIE